MADDDRIGFLFEGFDEPGQREALEREIARAAAAVARGEYDAALHAAGIDPAAARSLAAGQFELEAGQNLAGLDVTPVAMVLHAGVLLGSMALRDIWKKIVLPRLEAKFGPRVRPG